MNEHAISHHLPRPPHASQGALFQVSRASFGLNIPTPFLPPVCLSCREIGQTSKSSNGKQLISTIPTPTTQPIASPKRQISHIDINPAKEAPPLPRTYNSKNSFARVQVAQDLNEKPRPRPSCTVSEEEGLALAESESC